MGYFFTADEHYGHANIIKYCNRPFKTVTDMDEEIISRHNTIVENGDIVIHVGDFCFGKHETATQYIKRLKGTNIFLMGSHDKWSKSILPQIWEHKIDGQYIVACHYAMRIWPRSHYGSWQIYGHGHGKLPPIGKQWDVGVDNNDFYPVSFERLKEIMVSRTADPGNGLTDATEYVREGGEIKGSERTMIPNDLLIKLKYRPSPQFLPSHNELEFARHIDRWGTDSEDKLNIMISVFRLLYDAGIREGIDRAKKNLCSALEGE